MTDSNSRVRRRHGFPSRAGVRAKTETQLRCASAPVWYPPKLQNSRDPVPMPRASNQLTGAAMFFNRICEFQAESRHFARVLVDTAAQAGLCLPEQLRP